jgi:hypothetical protein
MQEENNNFFPAGGLGVFPVVPKPCLDYCSRQPFCLLSLKTSLGPKRHLSGCGRAAFGSGLPDFLRKGWLEIMGDRHSAALQLGEDFREVSLPS